MSVLEIENLYNQPLPSLLLSKNIYNGGIYLADVFATGTGTTKVTFPVNFTSRPDQMSCQNSLYYAKKYGSIQESYRVFIKYCVFSQEFSI